MTSDDSHHDDSSPDRDHHHGEDHDHHHADRHGHHHGHENDQGLKGALRYLRWLPSMWRSEINDTVVDRIDPQRGEHVVDVGAGLGAGTVRAARSGATVIAVEPTPYMRRALKLRRFLSRARKRIRVVDGAAESIPVDDGAIDAVWAVNTMHHWLDPRAGVAEIVRVLRPGGRILLVDEDFTDPTHPEHDRFGTSDDGHEHHGFTMVEADEMGVLFRTAGLDVVQAESATMAGRPSIVVTGRR